MNNNTVIAAFGGHPMDARRVGPDSLYIEHFFENQLGIADSNELMKRLMVSAQCAPRTDRAMHYRGNQLNRTKYFLVAREGPLTEDGFPTVLRRYWYTGWQWASMLFYRTIDSVPAIAAIVDELCASLTYKNERVIINHAIGTKYLSATDGIGFHNDKMRDIMPASPILILSLGERRELHLRENGSSTVDEVVVMEPGSLFILGPQTNELWQHSVVVVANERKIERNPGESLLPRMSLIFRNISTTVTREQVLDRVNKKRKRELKELTDN